ncbi:MAG: hypothetical protein M3209_08265 [Acidobacteriota bacterium]|nr:hypothetical protein [Acidobacteriota bacterium]
MKNNISLISQTSLSTVKIKQFTTKFLILSLLLIECLAVFPIWNPVLAQQSVVTVTADQPNIWTLEQAHYLLAQMHRRNLDLKAKGLSELDANQINGINIDVLRTLLQAGATYNEADRFNNSLVKEDKTFNAERRRELIQELDELQNESVDLTRVIARLKREKQTAESDDKKAKIEAEIVEKTEIKAAIDGQIDQKRKELQTLSAASGNVSATSSSATFNAQKFPTSGFDATFQKKAAEIIDSFRTNPQLNASLQLDNFLQLQYEIISKQLTLLRDEVGPGERLIFLELPQSVNATHDKSDDMWAQSRWRIAGYSRCEIEFENKSVPCQKVLNLSPNDVQNRKPRTTVDIFESITASESNVSEKYRLTRDDIRNPRRLTRKMFGYYDSPEDQLPNYQSPIGNFFSSRANTLESPQINSLKSELEDLKTDKAKLKKLNETLDECTKCSSEKLNNPKYVCNECTEDRKKDLMKNISELKEIVQKKEKRINEISTRVLPITLRLLNEIIQDGKIRYNQRADLNVGVLSDRNDILSNLSPSGERGIQLLNRLWLEDVFADDIYKLREADFPSKYVDLKVEKFVRGDRVEKNENPQTNAVTINIKPGEKPIAINNRLVRTVEMIPRQSSFNVNDVKIRNKSGAFNFIASFLFGFGANLDYQRQRERYSQFVQQELYSSAFGKGAREFGWTFTSMPGTDKLLSGLRTTYAIVVVPQEASSIVLESTGCSFDRTAKQPSNFDDAMGEKWTKMGNRNSCSPETKNFVVTIPNGGFDSSNDFYISGLTYQPVAKGKRIVVSIHGSNFTNQTGVLINGVPLPGAIGLAQNFIRDDSTVGNLAREALKTEKVRGGFERVDSNQIVAAFELVESDDPLPVITLVSPGKAVDINSLSGLYINGQRDTRLSDSAWFFGKKPSSDFIAILD